MGLLRRVLPPALAFLLPLAIYVRTLAPGLTPLDAGELAAVASTLGIAHPTGYPLFTLLGHAWLRLPLPGSPIHRLNLFAAFCVALSAVFFFAVTRRLLRWMEAAAPAAPDGARPTVSVDLVALASAWTYAFARTVWDQAVAIEVYPLQLALVMLSLWLFLRAVLAPAPRTRDWLIWAGSLGLVFTNHLTAVTLAPALLFLFVRRLGLRVSTLRVVVLMAAPFALALALYAYLPLRSAGLFPFHGLGPPQFDWGGVGRGWDAFWYHVTGRQYRVWMFTGVALIQLRRLAVLVPQQLGVVGLILLPIGFVALWRRRRELFWWTSLLVAGPLVYALSYSIRDIDSYFLLPFAGLIWISALGFAALVSGRRRLDWLLFALPAAALVINWTPCDRTRDYAAPDFAANLVSHLEPGALLISMNWDYVDSPLWYLQRVENLRPDLMVVSCNLFRRTWYPDQVRRWHPSLMAQVTEEERLLAPELEKFESGRPYDRDLLQARFVGLINGMIDRNINDRAVYIDPALPLAEPEIAAKWVRAPAGLVDRLTPRGAPPPPLVDRFELDRLISQPVAADDDLTRGLIQSAAAGVERTMRYAQFLGDEREADRLARLYRQLKAKLQ